MKKITFSLCMLAAVVAGSCNKNEQAAGTNPGKEVFLDLSDTTGGYFDKRFSQPTADLDKKAVLGRVLFYDGHLSLNNAVSCGSCHKQQFAFADNVPLSKGFEGRLAGRNTPPIQNLMSANFISFNNKGKLIFQEEPLFWDGRESNLVNLVLAPVSNHVEMGMADLSTLPDKLNALPYYSGLVQDAYHTDKLTLESISESIAIFMVAIKSEDSRFQRFSLGSEELTAQEQLGMQLFDTKYDCRGCHIPSGQYFSGRPSNNIGLDAVSIDKGVAAVTLNPQAEGAFVIPRLTNVALTAPYMHDGRFNTLDEVMEHYSTGIKDNPNLDPRLKGSDGKPMKMNISSDEKKAIIAFLHTLTDHGITTNSKFANPFRTK